MSKKLFSKVFILLLVVGLLFAVAPTGQAQAQSTLCVNTDGSGGCYTSIQDAITAAVAGETITVAAGIYHVPTTITLDKAISIIGPTTGEAKVIGTGTNMFKVFAITSSNVTIKDLEITLAVTPASPLLISDELNSSLISISGGAGMTGIIIQGNEIYVPVQTPPMTGWTARALTVGSNTVSGMVISGNTVYNTRNGIVIQGNNSATITGNTIYNTKGGIMNYTGTAEDAAARVMTNNSWGTVHNEWDIVWNSGGGPYDLDENVLVLGISQSNNDAYVVSLMPTAYPPPQLLNSNRSHVFVNATTGTETLHNANGNINVPYKKIQDAIDAVVPGGKVYVAAGTYAELLKITKPLTLLGPNAGIDGTTGTRNPEALITFPEGDNSGWSLIDAASDDITINGFTFLNTQIENTTSGSNDIQILGEDNEFINNRVISLAQGKKALKFIGPYQAVNDSDNDYDGVSVKYNYLFSPNTLWEPVYIQGVGAEVQYNTLIGGMNSIQIQPYSNQAGGVVSRNNMSAFAYPIWHNYQIGGNGTWIYEYNYLTPFSPTTDFNYQPIPTARWRGMLVQTETPNIEVRNNTFDGVDANNVVTRDDVIGLLFYAGLKPESVINVHDNEFKNVLKVVVNEGTVPADLGPIFTNNTFEKAAFVEGGSIIYTSIQDAIDAAADGDKILVGPGTYVETVTVNKDITLDGATDPFGSTPAVVQGLITISAQGATVQDLKVTPGSVVGQVAAVSVYASNTTVSGNLIDGMVGDNTATIKGIHVYGGSTTALENITISGNTVKNISNPGTLVKGTDGIQIQGNLIGVNVSNNIISAISSQGWAYGIEVTPSGANPTLPPQGVVISGNTITNVSAVTYPGIALSIDQYNAENTADASKVTAELNRFNALPVVNKDSAHSLNAERNWWGTSAGPQASMMLGTMDGSPWCTNEECTLFAETSNVTIAAVDPVVCGNTTTSTIDINVAGIPSSNPLQGYQFRLHFDPALTSIANLGTDIVNGDFVNNGGFLVANYINETTGAISLTPTSIVDIAYSQTYPSTSIGSGKLASITLTHKGLPGDIALLLSDVVLSTRDGLVIPSEASATPVTLTLSPAVLNITKVPNVGYCDLASAVLAADPNDVLQLQADITIPTMVKVTKALTLDLNGKTATVAAGKTALSVDTEAGAIGALIITDSTTGGLGKITGGARAVQVLNGASLVLNKGTLDGTTSDGVFVKTGSSVTVNGGTVTGLYFAIAGNGSAGQGGTTINITGGSLSSQYTAIYHPQAGTLNISGDAAISGHTGIEMRSGTLNISGTPTITTWGGFVANPGKVDGGSVESGDAILVYTHTDYAGEMVINISGGTFTSATGYALREYVADAFAASDVTSLTVTGGKFYGGLDAGEAGAAVTFSTELTALQLPELALKGGLYNTNPASPTVFVFVPYGTVYNTAQAMYEIVGISLNVTDFYYNNNGILRGVSTDFTVTNFVFAEATSVTVALFSGSEGSYELQQTNTLKVPTNHPGSVLTSSFDFFGTYISNSWENDRETEFGQTVAPTRVLVTVVLPGGTLTAENTILTGDRTTILPGVSGLVTLQGILAPKADVKIFLTSGTVVRDTLSTALSDINYGFTGVETLTYTFTTSQARYLNLTTDSGKTFLVDRDLTLTPLRLYGGDVDQNKEIQVNDASLVGQNWGSTTDPEANINYDGIVNIQDLALVGGNFGMTSATAYNWWSPLP